MIGGLNEENNDNNNNVNHNVILSRKNTTQTNSGNKTAATTALVSSGSQGSGSGSGSSGSGSRGTSGSSVSRGTSGGINSSYTSGSSGSSGTSGSSGSSGTTTATIGITGSNKKKSSSGNNAAAKAVVGATASNIAANVVNNAKNVGKTGNTGNSGTGNANANVGNSGNPANTAVRGFDLVGELTFGKIITMLVALYVLLMIGYLLSENYRVSSTLVQLDKYRNALFLDSMYLMKKKRQDKSLKQFYVASSFRPYLAINQMFEYCSLKILVRNVQNGVRAMFFDIFNDSLSEDAFPVVSSGYEKGNWKLTLNTLTFESVIRELSKTIFTSGYTNNYNDPFFLFLNLKTNRNFNSVNRVQETVYKYFKDRLLPSKYAYQSTKLADAPMRDLMGKVVIITSQGYENTNLEELVNASWNTEDMKKISYKALDAATPKSDAIKMNIDDVRTFSDAGITLVVPPEDSFFTTNYYPEPFFTAGCQFIFKNYQNNDLFMEPYITKFNSSSFVDK